MPPSGSMRLDEFRHVVRGWQGDSPDFFAGNGEDSPVFPHVGIKLARALGGVGGLRGPQDALPTILPVGSREAAGRDRGMPSLLKAADVRFKRVHKGQVSARVYVKAHNPVAMGLFDGASLHHARSCLHAIIPSTCPGTITPAPTA